MFSYVRGHILSIDGIQVTVIIDGIGLGLEVFASPLLLANIRIGEISEIYLHHHITDIGETLFGFNDSDERRIFRELLKVSGIGGKTALNLLGLGRENLQKAIQLEDDKLLSSVPGIGKKTAQKIIVDLKGSIDFTKQSPISKKKGLHTSDMILVSSLVQMGYDKTRAESVVMSIDSSLSLEMRTREAIQKLSK